MEESASFHVLVEVKQPPAESGPFKVKAHFSGVIHVSPVVARRKAFGYMGVNVAMAAYPGEPVLVTGSPSVWRVPFFFSVPGIDTSRTLPLGSVDVDALTGNVIELTESQTAEVRRRANAIVANQSHPATSAG